MIMTREEDRQHIKTMRALIRGEGVDSENVAAAHYAAIECFKKILEQ